jgi:DegV family protein with EDD domain
MTITIVTDTNSSLPSDISSKYKIIQVPIKIQFGEKSYTTSEDIDDRKLFELIDKQHALPTTAAPSPNAFKDAFQTALNQKADQIICICCSSEVSATYNAALMAAEMFPSGDISVIDSQQLCLAEGFQVLHAAKAAIKGLDKDEILDLIQDLQGRIHVYGALPTLKYLAMGGRVGKLAAGFADTFNIKPILTSQDGKLELLEKVRTWRKARERLIELAEGCTDGKNIIEVGLIHVNNQEGVAALHEMLAEKLSLPETALTAEFTPGLSVHTGSGVIGFVLITD